ncbi:peptidoglycan-binding protein [Streptomyces sp. BA2]|uniref:peptidoglycan-binding protein n=1 Tax=Streptomyces sp. BA2 TaxID=436595 RepID=UPI001327518F|nr:peptidoglycan-binding protein [Streptomyces sp. BA2]MWA08977.1 peptidoglycan-binding protein [Streptomyces sp. BA2]
MTAPDETRERERDEEAGEFEEAELHETSARGAGALELHTPGEVSERTPDAVGTASEETAPGAGDGDDDGGDGGEGTPPPPANRRRRRPLRMSLIVVVAIAVVAAAGAATTGVFGDDGSGSAGDAPSAPPKTAEVERTTLTRTETVDGNLGYGDATAVQAPAAAKAGAGIITWVPGDGDTVKRGEAAYRVEERQVPLLYGSTPFYRPLETGTEGRDVEILERNLSALGYTGFTVDDTYDAGTAEAVRDWQDDLGREETGTVQPSDAVVAPGARRVAEVKAMAGAPSNGPVLTWTGTERTVTVDLDVQYEDMVEKGTKATVTLPDDTTVQAEVTDVGTPSTPSQDGGSEDSGGQSGGDDKPTLPVELKVGDQKGLGRYQAAAVEISLKAETRKDVLVVPVNALVAQKGGGYAVEVAGADGEVKPRAVKVGMFADSMVEVSGAGITDGTVVGVPK